MLIFAFVVMLFRMENYAERVRLQQSCEATTLYAQKRIDDLRERIGGLRARLASLHAQDPAYQESADPDKLSPCEDQCFALCRTADCLNDTQNKRDRVAQCAKSCVVE